MCCNSIIDVSYISFCPSGSGIDMCCNSIIDVSFIKFCNGNIINGGGGDVEKLFFKQPDAPKDLSSNFINSGGSQYIEITFDIPASAIKAGTIYQNSSTVFYKDASTNQNWLPAMNNLRLDA